MKGPPPRLLFDPATPAELRTDLTRVARATHEYDAAQGLSAFQQSLKALDGGGGAALAPESALSSATSAGSSAGAAWAAKTLIAALIGTGAWTAWTSWQERAPLPTSHQPPPAAAPARAANAHTEAPASLPTPDIAPPVAATASSGRPIAPQRPAAHREIEQLEQVKALLPTDPAAAYRLAQQSAREFPSGVLREEREGLSVIALWRLGKHAQAHARAAQFLERYPQSPLRARIEGLTAPPQ